MRLSAGRLHSIWAKIGDGMTKIRQNGSPILTTNVINFTNTVVTDNDGTADITASFPDGTIALPSIGFASDPTTGLCRATDLLGFSVNGVAVAKLKPTGLELADSALSFIGSKSLILMDDAHTAPTNHTHLIDFGTTDANIPSVGGWKIRLWGDLGVQAASYGFGIASGTLWANVPSGARHRWYHASVESASLESTGQFRVPTTGADAGILLGTDVHLYRAAANILALSGATWLEDNTSTRRIVLNPDYAAGGVAPAFELRPLSGYSLTLASTGFARQWSLVGASSSANHQLTINNPSSGNFDVILASGALQFGATPATAPDANQIVFADNYRLVGSTTTAGGAVPILQWYNPANNTSAAIGLGGSPPFGIISTEFSSGRMWVGYNLVGNDASTNALVAKTLAVGYSGVRFGWGDITFHAITGSVTAGDVANAQVAALSAAGQLTLPITGSAAGVLLGGDVHLYRSAANILALGTGDSLIPIDASGQILGSATNRWEGYFQTLDVAGTLRVGTATDVATTGDFVAGLIGAARMFFDVSDEMLAVHRASDGNDVANLGRMNEDAAYGGVWFQGTTVGAATDAALFGKVAQTMLNVSVGGTIYHRVGNATVMSMDSAGLDMAIGKYLGWADAIFYRAAANTIGVGSGDSFIPFDATGQALGGSNNRWEGYFQTLDAAGTLTADQLRVGTATDTATAGDFAAGLTGAARMVYDVSDEMLNLYRASDGAQIIGIGRFDAADSHAGIWLRQAPGSTTTYSLLSDGSDTFVNGPNRLYFRIANATIARILSGGLEIGDGKTLGWADAYFERSAANTVRLASGDNFIPADATGQALGGSNNRWDAFVNDLDIIGNTVGSLVPSVDDTDDLGSPTKQLRNVFIKGDLNIDQAKIASTTASTTQTLTDTDNVIQLVDTTTGALTTNLPLAPSAERFFIIKNIGANTLTIGRNGKTIDGVAADLTLAQNEFRHLYYDGTGWQILGK
jgi:hypothetical protein